MSFRKSFQEKYLHLSSQDLKKQIYKMNQGEIEDLVDGERRHVAQAKPTDYANHWVKITRCFSQSTAGDVWAEIEKHLPVIVKRLVTVEKRNQKLEDLVFKLSQEPAVKEFIEGSDLKKNRELKRAISSSERRKHETQNRRSKNIKS